MNSLPSQLNAVKHTLRDNSGRPYSLLLGRTGDCWAFWVRDRGTPVGNAECLGKGETLFLSEIHMRDEVQPRWPECLRFLGWFGLKRSLRSYRGRGIGTALLRFLNEHARQSGFKRIEGNLLPRDLDHNPRLPDWYRRQGFDVVMQSDLKSGKVCLDLGEAGVFVCPK